MLEPYGQPRDIHYVIVAPENDYVLNQVAAFFQHLSVMYEQCRLGRHRPVSDKLRDGIMRVGRANAQKVADEPLDDWFRDIGSMFKFVLLIVN
jgi:mediator of RNA polymerase II transcription subunit 13